MRELLDRQLYRLDLRVHCGGHFASGAPLTVPAETGDVRRHTPPNLAGCDHPLGCFDARMSNGVDVAENGSPEADRHDRPRVRQ